jgi:phosphohistidine phosphatase
MRLYLVQHGDALPEVVDADRRLSDKGQHDVRRHAEFLAQRGIRVGRVVHSGKTRARQTAEILAGALAPGIPVEEQPGLGPNDSIHPWPQLVADWEQDAVVVGHLPFMARLVAQLVAGREDRLVAAYRPGGVVCLERGHDGVWSIVWMIGPELLA